MACVILYDQTLAMLNQHPYRNSLQIGSNYKGIPYGPVDRGAEGKNHGFQLLNGNPHLIDTSPELQSDPELKNLVSCINLQETGLLTIGCLSEPIQDEHGHRFTGYVEFAFNSKSRIADASNYFPVFFHFAEGLRRNGFIHQMAFDWQLEPGNFFQCGTMGYTCSIFLNSAYKSESTASDEVWSHSLFALAEYLKTVPQESEDYLYFPQQGGF